MGNAAVGISMATRLIFISAGTNSNRGSHMMRNSYGKESSSSTWNPSRVWTIVYKSELIFSVDIIGATLKLSSLLSSSCINRL